MKDLTKVTVVIPVYNVEPYLRDCLDSVRNQTLKDIEIICIDDASPDNCGQILDEYAAEDRRFRVFHLPKNRMQGYGRNLGLRSAEGKYTYFIDSDDMIEPNALETLYEIAERDRLDLAVFWYRNEYETEELRKKKFLDSRLPVKSACQDSVCSGPELFDDMIRGSYWTCIPQIYFWRTEFLRGNGIESPEKSYHEDEYVAFAGLLLAERARFIPKKLFIKRFREDSVMTRKASYLNCHGYMMNYWYMNRFVTERNIHSYAAERDISYMLGASYSTYREVDHDVLREYCSRDPEELLVYECVTSSLRAFESWYTIRPNVLAEITRYKKVSLFGTGRRADQTAGILSTFGIAPKSYIVFAKGASEGTYKGKPIVALKDCSREEDAIIVIPAGTKNRWLIERALTQKKMNWVVHRKTPPSKIERVQRKLRKMIRPARFS